MTGTAKTKLSPHTGKALAVLIAGAGPTGLAPACRLARRGVSFCLIEAAGPVSASVPRAGGAGHGLQP